MIDSTKQIFIRTLAGKSKVLDISTSSCLHDIKLILQDQEGIPIDQQLLTYNGKHLIDQYIVNNLLDDSTLILLLKLKGGSGVQMPKWKSYTMPSWELNSIVREPPKSIFTRKKERVDMSNVNYMIRSDDSRINEGVSYLARGINPHIDVQYTNANYTSGGSATTSLAPRGGGSNPMKAIKDGAFRPPLYFLEDRLPLSRMRRPETAAITNPGIITSVTPHFANSVDMAPIKTAIDVVKTNYIPVRPTAMYKIQMPTEVFTRYAIEENPLQVAAGTNVIGQTKDVTRDTLHTEYTPNGIILTPVNTSASAAPGSNLNTVENFRNMDVGIQNIKDNLIIQNVSPNFSIAIYDPMNKNYSEVHGTQRERLNIAVQSANYMPIDLTRSDGTQVKVKDYRWQIVKSAKGRDSLVLNINNNNQELVLDRNLPLYAVGTSTSGYTAENRYSMDPIMNQQLHIPATSAVSLSYGRNSTIHDYEPEINLRRRANYGSFENSGTMRIDDNDRSTEMQPMNLLSMSVKQIAAQNQLNRYDNY